MITLSCKKEGCLDDTATNYDPEAKTSDGSCIYPEPDPREPYLGTYTVLDTFLVLGAFDHATTYTLNITTGGTSSDTLLLKNLWGDGDDYYCGMNGTGFTVFYQQVDGPYYTTGTGDLANSAITYSTSGDVYVHNGIGTKD